MISRIVEIAHDGHRLSLSRGFLVVQRDEAEVGRVPVDDVAAVILTARHATLSRALMAALFARGSIVVTCGDNFLPLGISWPFAAHHESAGVLADQIAASRPLTKRLWQQIVCAKIDHQANVLEGIRPEARALSELQVLRRQVRSGDPDNREAQAARHYWPALMGGDFRRDRKRGGINSALNYGYTVLRAGVIRALCASGLHPALGLHHGTRVNSFALADDIMEPFRPLIDRQVFHLDLGGSEDLNRETKAEIAAVLETEVIGGRGATSLISAIHEMAQSLAAVLAGRNKQLTIAQLPPPQRLL